MSNPIKHHFLPQFYQRGWAGPDGKVTEFTRPRDQLIAKRRFPSETGYKPELYSIESRTDPAARQALEKELMSSVDNGAARFIDHIRKRPGEAMRPEDGDAWATFVVSLLHRTPYMIQKLKKALKQREPQVLADVAPRYDELRSVDDPESFEEFVAIADPSRLPEAFGKLLDTLVNSDRTRRALRSMEWAIATLGAAPFSLMTSDSPLVTSDGIAYRTSFLILPIGPKEIFIGGHRRDVIESFTTQRPRNLALALNDAITRQARSLVIAEDDRQRRFVDNRLGKSGEPRSDTGRWTWKCPIVDLTQGPPLF